MPPYPWKKEQTLHRKKELPVSGKKEPPLSGKKEAKDEAERDDRYLIVLKDINKIILEEASKLHAALPEFHGEVQRLQSGPIDVRDLVGVLIKELEIHFDQRRSLEQYAGKLERKYNALESQMQEKDSEALQKLQRSIVAPKVDRSNIVQEPQDEIQKLAGDVSRLEAEKRCVEEGQQALRLEHENETQKLKIDHERRVWEIRREHERVEGNLEEKHNNDKIRQQRTYDTEKREFQENLQTKHDSEKWNLQTAHDREKNRLRSGYDAEEKRMGSVIAQLERDLAAERRDLQFKITKFQDQHETEKRRLIDDHESKRKRLVARITEMQQNHESTIEQMKREHESERAQWHATNLKMLQDYKSEKDLMQNKHSSTLAQISQEHDSAIARMSEEHNSVIAQMSQEHASELAQQIALISRMEKEHASEQEKMRNDFEARKLQLECETAEEKSSLKTDFEVRKVQLEKAHEDEKERLRKDVDEYSAALLARDDFKPTPDNEIKARFLDLVQDVDALARLEWKVSQKDWTSQVLRGLSRNQRLLKKQILQDSVWVILHEYIFCSPFRILGEEGRSLETQWNEECGKDSQLDNGIYTWPKPEMETERWRYVNIKECRAALRQPVPSEWDPRAKLKRGFKTSIDALRKELTSTVGEVATLDKNSIQAMEKMTMKAVNLWLEFGMQRCRLSMVLQGSNLKSAKERVQRAQEDILKLVVVPELKRFGNSKGLDLHIEQTVGGCDGETIEISMQR